jgi:hypothetical protein
LPDHERDGFLRQVSDLFDRRGAKRLPTIVFEGNQPADPHENRQMMELLEAESWPPSCTSPKVWLGAAVAIKDPTSAVLRRQSGANLLIVGQSPRPALGVMANCAISLAEQFAVAPEEDDSEPGCLPGEAASNSEPGCLPGEAATGDAIGTGADVQGAGEMLHRNGDAAAHGTGARIVILDGSYTDAPEADSWRLLAEALPHSVRLARSRGAAAEIERLAADLQRRRSDPERSWPSVYLLIYHLGRFRDLRRSEDDFGLSGFGGSDDSPANAAKGWADLLRDGPALGMHSIVWCDTYNNVTRWLDRSSMREMEMRVAFQMSATDSSNLLDSPSAGRLGVNRGLLYMEEHGTLEKFRPYAPPSEEWLDEVRQKLQRPVGSLSRR